MKKWFVRFLKFVVAPVLAIVVVTTASLLAYRVFKQKQIAEARAITSPNGIEVLERIEIGGDVQWIQIRGQDKANPVLLYLHGGPGSPMMPMGYAFQDKWEDHFTVVHWDQREAGKNYRGVATSETMNKERMIEDTLELVAHLRNRFDRDKIVVLGHSWGSVLGVYAIQRRPEWFHAYVGVGQVVNMMENERVTYEYTVDQAKKRNEANALKKLEEIAPYPGENMWEKILVQRKWLLKFGGALYGRTSYAEMGKLLAFAPEYTLTDAVNYLRGSTFGLDLLLDELMAVDIEQLGYEFETPIFIFSGRYDYQVPSTVNEAWFEKISAPHKEYVWFEESCHAPMLAEPDKFADALIGRVLPVVSTKYELSGDPG